MRLQYKKKLFATVALSIVSFVGFVSVSSACNIFDWSDCDNAGQVIYCKPGDNCSIDSGTQVVANNINSIEKHRTFSSYVQDVVAYLLVFLGIVGVLYIIYAGFNILTAAGDEDKVKKSKSTVLHVIAGLILIFLAYSIVRFVIGQNGQ